MQGEVSQMLKQIGRPRLLVVGDVILDRYTWGSVERVSPEAPVPVLRSETRDVRLGGAGSVATLARALDAEVELAGVVGEDAAALVVHKLVDEQGIGRTALLGDAERPTTTKERFMGRVEHHGVQQVLRVDQELTNPLQPELCDQLTRDVGAGLSRCGAVLVSDYGKGVCIPGLLRDVMRFGKQAAMPVVVDPAPIDDYSRYRGATLITPNRSEAERATRRAIHTHEDAVSAGRDLCHAHGFEAVLITLDRDGLVMVERGSEAQVFSVDPRDVFDVAGAGDMVLAVVGMAIASGLPLQHAAMLANVAAGLEVERLGVAPVSREEIATALQRSERTSVESKFLTPDQAGAVADAYRRRGRKFVLTNGCFDLLHFGHVCFLQEAARLGDVLVVALNGDESVRRLKGPGRPIVGASERAALVAALACVDHVLVFEEDTPHEIIRRLRPDVLVKGGGYGVDDVVGRELAEQYGGLVCTTGRFGNHSTTNVIRSLVGEPAGPSMS